jgi:hypothetical protein
MPDGDAEMAHTHPPEAVTAFMASFDDPGERGYADLVDDSDG